MNQTKKRLSIINLAISITDIETIQLQMLKLGLLITDTKIQEIIAVLQAENYAKAQRLIKLYIDSPMEEILQRSSQKKLLDIEELTPSYKEETIISNEDQKIIDEFKLFITSDDNSPKQTKKKEIDINDFLTDVSPTPNLTVDTQEEDFDALLKMDPDDVMPDNIELNINQGFDDSFFDVPQKKEKLSLNTETIDRDTFFDIDKSEDAFKEEASSKDTFEKPLTVKRDRKASLMKDAAEKALHATALQRSSSDTEKKEELADISQKDPLEEKLLQKSKREAEIENYPAISYIRQKFSNIKKQYEPIQKNHERCPTVETFLTTISQDGYKEKEIEETLKYIEKLINEQKFSEAAQLLLVCASTESKFAQLMLARELYRGVILRKNIDEAFVLLKNLAEKNHPEALCDLGQFYEHAIATKKDIKQAKELYKKAMDLGIKRAGKHYTRLKKQRKGLFKK